MAASLTTAVKPKPKPSVTVAPPVTSTTPSSNSGAVSVLSNAPGPRNTGVVFFPNSGQPSITPAESNAPAPFPFAAIICIIVLGVLLLGFGTIYYLYRTARHSKQFHKTEKDRSVEAVVSSAIQLSSDPILSAANGQQQEIIIIRPYNAAMSGDAQSMMMYSNYTNVTPPPPFEAAAPKSPP